MLIDQCNNEKVMDVSSEEEPYDSDQIDSDVEAELYSVIHHDSSHSLNISNNKNGPAILDYKEFGITRESFEKSNQIVWNDNNLTNVQVIEIIDKVSSDKSVQNADGDSLENDLLKRKSDSDHVDLDDNQTCKKQKNNDLNTSENLYYIDNSKSNEAVALNSSDEDNDIICLGPVENENFKTNVTEIIITDSDSNSNDNWCFKSPKINTSTPSAVKTKDLWFVNDDDLYRSRRHSSRYHESQLTTCSLCNQKGHSVKFCTFKGLKCFICGNNHSYFSCKNKVCAKCFAFGHDIKHCPKRMDLCKLCKMRGHHQGACPDLWRRFQRTTPKRSRQIWKLVQDKPYYCYNCGFPGHFGALCKNQRMIIPGFPTWPFVLNYKLQKEGKVKPRVKAPNKVSVIADNDQQQIPKEKKKKKKVKKNLSGVDNTQKISFPRTPETSNMKPQNDKSCIDKDSKLTGKFTKKAARKAKRNRLRKKAQKKKLVEEKTTANENIN